MSLLSQILARRMGLVAPLTRDVVCRADLPVQAGDGVVLLADRWVAAADEHRPRPTVLVRSPYGRKQFVGLLFGRLLAERGLQVVIQSVRGTFGSGGRFSPFDERTDGLATLDWLRAQPWHDGPVGMFGPSYLGYVQWAVARPDGAGGPAPPDALAIQVSASQFFDQTYPGGSLSLETLASWMALIAAQEARVAVVAIDRALRGLRSAITELPLTDLDERATGSQIDWFREAFADVDRGGAYWSARDHSPAVGEVTAPATFVGGWYDILLPWMLADFEALQAAGRAPRLTIGPWTHTSPGLVGAGHRDGIAWLRDHLLGDDRLVDGAPVRVLVTGERSGGGWRELDRWPPAGTGERRLWLAGDGGLIESAPGASSGGDRYTYDPADPTPSLGGPVLLERVAVLDNGPLEARDDVLVYTSAPLPETVEAIGPVSAQLWARGSGPSFDLFARVCDVDGGGVSRNVTDGLVTVTAERFSQDDGVYRVTVPLWPIGHRFAAGHRIRLLVASGAHPRYGRNPGTGEPPQLADPATMRAVDVEILRDADHPSAVVLPASG